MEKQKCSHCRKMKQVFCIGCIKNHLEEYFGRKSFENKMELLKFAAKLNKRY